MTHNVENGPIDFGNIERKAQELRAQAMRDGMRALGAWLRAHFGHGARRA